VNGLEKMRKLSDSDTSIWTFPFICSLQKCLIAILSNEFELLLVLFVFPSFFAPKLGQNHAWINLTIGASFQPSFLETADFNPAFDLAKIPLSGIISQLATATASFVGIFPLLLVNTSFAVCTTATNLRSSQCYSTIIVVSVSF
jgi:hypothetical protein